MGCRLFAWLKEEKAGTSSMWRSWSIMFLATLPRGSGGIPNLASLVLCRKHLVNVAHMLAMRTRDAASIAEDRTITDGKLWMFFE